VPGELLLRELLGYEVLEGEIIPGGRPSKFELARNGILFFQDVEYLPLEAQVTLLNVLELGVVLRQGSYRPVPVDVRIIASSTARLDQLAAQGSFRSDLLYRLGSIQIKLPPLRERARDIPLLAERILERISRQVERPLHLVPASYDLLRRYPWPGNIRELEAALSQAAAQAGADSRIDPSDLPEYIRAPVVFQGNGQVPVRVPSLLEVEREALLQTAHLCGGNVTQMARVLGLGRTTVWRKLKEFDIVIDSYRVPPDVELRS
jgi:transcriptional activator for dhaKLM operon